MATPPFVQQSAAAAGVLSITVAAFAVGEFSQVVRRRPGARTVDLRGELLFRLVFFAGILLLPLGAAVAPGAQLGGGPGTFVTGTAVAWLGLLLRWWSFLTLGRYFTVVLQTSSDQVVVDRGPYRLLRHPSYTGLLLAFLGVGIMLGNWVAALASVALVLVALVHRIRIEERALVAALGDRYRTFADGRARLVPFLW